MIAGKFEATTSMSLREEIHGQFVAALADAVDQMALQMIANDMFPSRGWRIGYTIDTSDLKLSFTVFPVAP